MNQGNRNELQPHERSAYMRAFEERARDFHERQGSRVTRRTIEIAPDGSQYIVEEITEYIEERTISAAPQKQEVSRPKSGWQMFIDAARGL